MGLKCCGDNEKVLVGVCLAPDGFFLRLPWFRIMGCFGVIAEGSLWTACTEVATLDIVGLLDRALLLMIGMEYLLIHGDGPPCVKTELTDDLPVAMAFLDSVGVRDTALLVKIGVEDMLPVQGPPCAKARGLPCAMAFFDSVGVGDMALLLMIGVEDLLTIYGPPCAKAGLNCGLPLANASKGSVGARDMALLVMTDVEDLLIGRVNTLMALKLLLEGEL